jgi:hypothetical protein
MQGIPALRQAPFECRRYVLNQSGSAMTRSENTEVAQSGWQQCLQECPVLFVGVCQDNRKVIRADIQLRIYMLERNKLHIRRKAFGTKEVCASIGHPHSPTDFIDEAGQRQCIISCSQYGQARRRLQELGPGIGYPVSISLIRIRAPRWQNSAANRASALSDPM